VLNDDAEIIRNSYVGELLGPVRPHRPILPRAVGATWFEDRARDSHFTVHIRFR